MNNQDFIALPFMPDPKIIAEKNNNTLKQIFAKQIRGYFLVDIKERVMKELGLGNLVKYYDFRWSNERMITGIGESPEYDICRMIVGIHRAYSIFLSDDEIRKNEKSKRYKQRIVFETLEKIKLRPYGSAYFRKKTLLLLEEFLYYPLPYELFSMCVRMGEVLNDTIELDCLPFYYGIMYNGISALSLMGDNLLCGAYPLCRGAIEIYLKLLILNIQTKAFGQYVKFSEFEIEQSCCTQVYPEEFNLLFINRICRNSVNKVDYLHFGWVDVITEYHNVVRKHPYSIYGIIVFLKDKNKDRIYELEQLESFYKLCHAYTHGNLQSAKYPVLHYFEISIMLYYIIRNTFLLLCKEKGVETIINEMNIIAMIDRDFEVLYEKYNVRSTENFERMHDR